MSPSDIPLDLPPDPALDARLSELRSRFKSVLPQRLGTILTQLGALKAGQWSPELVAPMQTEVHSLAGSAGLFGFDEIGSAAGQLEHLLIQVSRQAMATDADLERIYAAAEHLRATAAV